MVNNHPFKKKIKKKSIFACLLNIYIVHLQSRKKVTLINKKNFFENKYKKTCLLQYNVVYLQSRKKVIIVVNYHNKNFFEIKSKKTCLLK
jgi:hypothetical protein